MLVKGVFFLLNAAFAMAIQDLIPGFCLPSLTAYHGQETGLI
jgi:hypothetical protein